MSVNGPMYFNPSSSKRIPGVKRPLRIPRPVLRGGKRICRCWKGLQERHHLVRNRFTNSPSSGVEIADRARHWGDRHFIVIQDDDEVRLICPAWLRPSKARPAVIDPSPMMARTFPPPPFASGLQPSRERPRWSPLWPNQTCRKGFPPASEAADASMLSQVENCLALPVISLWCRSDVPHPRRVCLSASRRRSAGRASIRPPEIGCQVAPFFERSKGFLPDLLCKSLDFLEIKPLDIEGVLDLVKQPCHKR